MEKKIPPIKPHRAIVKILRTIESCETIEQLGIANTMLWNFYRTNTKDYPNTLTKAHDTKLTQLKQNGEESEKHF